MVSWIRVDSRAPGLVRASLSGVAPGFFTRTASAPWDARSLVELVRTSSSSTPRSKLSPRTAHVTRYVWHALSSGHGSLRAPPRGLLMSGRFDSSTTHRVRARRRRSHVPSRSTSLSKKSRSQASKWFWLLVRIGRLSNRAPHGLCVMTALPSIPSRPLARADDRRDVPTCEYDQRLRAHCRSSRRAPGFDRAREQRSEKRSSLCTRPGPLEGSSCVVRRPLTSRRLRDAGSRAVFVTFPHLPRRGSRSRPGDRAFQGSRRPHAPCVHRRAGFRQRVASPPSLSFPNRRETDTARDFRREPVVDFCLVHDVACTSEHVCEPRRNERWSLARPRANEPLLARRPAPPASRDPRFPEGGDDSRPMRPRVRATFLVTNDPIASSWSHSRTTRARWSEARRTPWSRESGKTGRARLP